MARGAEPAAADELSTLQGRVIICPPDVELLCGQTPDPRTTGSATATADCGGPITITYADAPLPADCTGSGIERTWSATGCGHRIATCTQRIMFADVTPPRFITFLAGSDFVPCGWPVPEPVIPEVEDDCDPNPSVVVTDESSGPDAWGMSSLLRTWTVTDRCGKTASFTALIMLDACPTSDTLSWIAGVKFYDANANGVQDPGEGGIGGWKITLHAPANLMLSTMTDSAGRFTFASLPAGWYHLEAATPLESGWQQTTSPFYEINLGAAGETRDFGGLCLGGESAKPVSFWAEKEGSRLLNESKGAGAELALLRQLNLRNGNGSDFDPVSYHQLKVWLEAASGSTLAHQLSAEVAAMGLNVNASLVKRASRLHAPGTVSANALGYGMVEGLLAEANRELEMAGTSGLMAVEGVPQAYPGMLIQALRAANGNQSFVQEGPCPFRFEP